MNPKTIQLFERFDSPNLDKNFTMNVLLFNFLNLADVITTYIGLSLGATEKNLFMFLVMETIGFLPTAISKLLIMALLSITIVFVYIHISKTTNKKLRILSRFMLWGLMIYMIISYAITVVNNCMVISELRI